MKNLVVHNVEIFKEHKLVLQNVMEIISSISDDVSNSFEMVLDKEPFLRNPEKGVAKGQLVLKI